MKLIFKTILAALLCLAAASCGNKAPRTTHVIILGYDGMSAVGVQRAHTPNFNRLIENGAVSMHTRSVRETSSSQNWMSMVSASPIEMHTVFTNAWKPDKNENTPPALTNAKGFYPTIFDHIRAQKPDLRQYAFIEWTGETRMYDMDAFDTSYVKGWNDDLKDYRDVFDKAVSVYLDERPEMMFVSLDIPDHIGHTYGHESKKYLDCLTELDSLTGAFIDELDRRGWMKNTVVLICADHGGLGLGHGGDSMAEYEIPVILYGDGVTKGKVMKHTNMIYDIGATAAGLLGVELPWECRGKLLTEAFEPADDAVYVPVPLVTPFKGRCNGPVTMSVDDPDAVIYYTIDGSEPSDSSVLYEGPFELHKASKIRSVAYRKGSRSIEAVNFLNPKGYEAPVHYKLYRDMMENDLPDFTKFGKPSETGYIDNFSLDQLNVSTEDHFAVLFSSNLVVPKDADYKFQMMSDDGAKLYIDGELLINNAAAHSIRPAFGKLRLTEGKHLMKIEFYEISSVQSLTLLCSINAAPYRPLMATDLDR